MAAETSHRVATSFETFFQRDYHSEAPDLRRLYENAKRDQWNASRDIDWKMSVDLERGIFADELIDGHGSEYWNRLDKRRQSELNVEFSCWRLSQLLHGEEGAMLACSQLVDMVPGNDAKFFQTTQVQDEARHAEVLSRYLIEKAGGRRVAEFIRSPPTSRPCLIISWARANGSSKPLACSLSPRLLRWRCSEC